MPSEDIFTLLHLPRDTPDAEIKREYHEAIRDGEFLHPDRGGDRERFERLQNAYQEYQCNPAAAPTADADDFIWDAEPLLSPTVVDWTVEAGITPSPVTVTLLYPGGLENVSGVFGPDEWAGTFWTIEVDTSFESDGDEIFQVKVVPADTTSLMSRGKSEERAIFVVNGHEATLTIRLTVKTGREAPRSRAEYSGPRTTVGGASRPFPTSSTTTPEGAAPTPTSLTAMVIGLATLIALGLILSLAAGGGSGGPSSAGPTTALAGLPPTVPTSFSTQPAFVPANGGATENGIRIAFTASRLKLILHVTTNNAPPLAHTCISIVQSPKSEASILINEPPLSVSAHETENGGTRQASGEVVFAAVIPGYYYVNFRDGCADLSGPGELKIGRLATPTRAIFGNLPFGTPSEALAIYDVRRSRAVTVVSFGASFARLTLSGACLTSTHDASPVSPTVNATERYVGDATSLEVGTMIFTGAVAARDQVFAPDCRERGYWQEANIG